MTEIGGNVIIRGKDAGDSTSSYNIQRLHYKFRYHIPSERRKEKRDKIQSQEKKHRAISVFPS